MVWTRLCAALAVALVALAAPVSAPAAPEGKVVIAQGVDPSTLDAMNQQETPASVVATHIYDTLVERVRIELLPRGGVVGKRFQFRAVASGCRFFPVANQLEGRHFF